MIAQYVKDVNILQINKTKKQPNKIAFSSLVICYDYGFNVGSFTNSIAGKSWLQTIISRINFSNILSSI
nr:MAG TPA: hypothetical protein [Caudoviricetes sp.]